MNTKKSRAELEIELRMLKNSRVAEGVILVIITLIKCATIAIIFYYLYLMVVEIAGKTTFADIGISFLGNIHISIGIAWVFGISGIFYGLKQKSLRKDTVERLQKRIVDLEKFCDDKRTSSQLTTRGDTRPEDKI